MGSYIFSLIIFISLVTFLLLSYVKTITTKMNYGNMADAVALCEPAELYNILTEDAVVPVLTDKTHLLLIDARERKEYDESHVIVARHAPICELTGQFTTFADIDLPMVVHVVVYDNKTVSAVEETRAIKYAEMLYFQGSKNTVKVVKGGYERFSAEYPFLRTQKIMYSPLELEHMPRYPNEILPLFLYIGDRSHACNASMNYDLKINSHVNMIADLDSPYPGTINELHIEVEDKEDTDLLANFEEIYSFIEAARNKSERVLVFSELGISRAPVACMAYLMKKNKWTLQTAYEHVCKYRRHTRPLRAFINQLSKWEETIHGETLTDISEPNY